MNQRVTVDPIKCTAHGMCAELFPEWIELDDWGYPVVRAGPVPAHLRQHAVKAVRACPAMALRLVDAPGDPAPRA
jgi:ferredoxin